MKAKPATNRAVHFLPRPQPLRLAVVSAMGLCGMLAAGHAHAYSCQYSPDLELAAGTSVSHAYAICKGDDGVDDDYEDKLGGVGPDISAVSSASISPSSSTQLSPVLYGTSPGVLMMHSLGGTGVDEGYGGAAGAVTITNDGNISLTAQPGNKAYFASLISAVSEGGSGDTYNDNNNSDGGDGGKGGDLNITNKGALSVTGGVPAPGLLGMSGISATSVGARGGDQNGSIFDDQVGGDGGAGGSITVSNQGDINIGSASARMGGLAQGAGIRTGSSGGTGGTDNGDAGNAGWLDVRHDGNINVFWDSTQGTEGIIYSTSALGVGVYGINAYSVGGMGTPTEDTSNDGGDGGDGLSVTLYAKGQILVDVAGPVPVSGAAIAARSVGGNGGMGPKEDHRGGDGGSANGVWLVLENSDTALTTHGNDLHGIMAQSLGGQGGPGRDGAALAGQGGGGGYGGDAMFVNVTTQSDTAITTTGNYSSGILAQSIGGGGGTGSDFVSVLGGQGGQGGNGGDGDEVTISAGGDITTGGDHAYGILAQSIAGSGGAGGVSASGVVALGGDGAGGGSAGDVTVTNTGHIATSGYTAHGINAQSIGGGGGASGSALGALSIGGSAEGATGSQGGPVLVSSPGTIETAGDASAGIIAQSIGGGGGNGGDSKGVIGVGGDGAGAGHGGAVSLRELGTIQTSGSHSPGVLAQSIGGGGGSGGSTMTVSAGASIAIGGSGSGGGNGGSVCLSNAQACDGWSSSYSSHIVTHGDYSPGMLAQNIGGGGGNGGSVDNISVGSLVAFQLGGSASNGGAAGGPVKDSSGNIIAPGGAVVDYDKLTVNTGGAHAPAIVAQSIGGGGGNGGDASYYNATVGFSASLVVGGGGGAGGTGYSSKVLLNDSQIGTGMDYASADPETYAPNDSIGILAQTVGGGGGNGGSSSAASMVIAVPPVDPALPPVSINLSAAIGGAGGDGGHACPDGDSSCLTQVALTGTSSVSTLGDGSHAIAAQSIGGGGGNGGDASAMTVGVGYGDALTGELVMSLGGAGGKASNGGKVQVDLGNAGGAYASLPGVFDPSAGTLAAPASSIVTYGDFANGVQAQSIGGGGGNGGVGSSNAYAAGGLASVKLTMALGGAAGGGGAGGEVGLTLHPDFAIHTVGSGSRGMLAQSIGGGGGTAQGGTMNLSAGFESVGGSLGLGLGQTGGDGGAAGAVSADIDGAIRTEGGDADGVMLQSIGGGGGLGGSIGADSSSNPILDRIGVFQSNKARLTDAGQSYTFNVDLGGRGGKGGDGGSVDLDFSGKIATGGDWADGIVAQSIGGGGGTGGSSTASGSKVRANLAFAIGGTGGAAGNGGAITAYFDGNHENSILTEGYSAHGVLLQSIGGGGGQGGDGSDMASGTFTIGGSDGGNGGTSGAGGAIALRGTSSWLTVETKGSDSPAFAAQSIGGGGGMGGAGNSDSNTIKDSHAISLSVGGRGGTGNHGGSIDLTQGLGATTHGDRAYGLLAQSIGGGGGVGSAGDAGNITSLTLGGRGGAGGDGAAVALSLNKGSYINTSGAGAHGIIAQSIGGGGGIAGDSSAELLPGSGRWMTGIKDATETGGNGSGNTVKVAVNDGGISTSGPRAYGIIAQSIGGGGGLVGDREDGYLGTTSTAGNGTGRGGAVTVTQSGSIEALGASSVGIFAQSEGPEGAGAVRVDLHGNVSGGTGDASYGVWIADGNHNALNIYEGAQVAGGEGASQTAIRYDGSGSGIDGYFLTVTNYGGTIKGGVYCSNASGQGDVACDVFGNHNSLMTDATLYQANIDNAGTVVVGRPGMTDTLTVTGNYVQRATGVLQTTVDFEKLKAGRMVVQGDARLDGYLDLITLSLLPERELTVLSVQGDSSGALQAQDSPIFDFHTWQTGRDHKVNVIGADFAASSQRLSRNQREVARHLQRIWDDKGTEDLARLFGFLNQASKQGADAYRERLSDLSPGATLAPAAQMVGGMGRFTDAMMSCPVMEGSGTGMREQNCYWGQVTRRSTSQDGADGYSGFSFDSTTYQIGGQREFRPDWFLGGSVAYQNNHMDSDDGRSGGKGDAGYAGVVLKHQKGPWVFSGALGGGYGSYDLSRGLNIDGYQRQAKGKPDVYSLGARLRAARHIGITDNFYLKPYVDLEALYTRMPGYTESGDALSLEVSSSDQTVLSLSPMLEVGGRVDLPKGATMRPFAYAGASFLSEDSWSAHARLKGAPAGGPGMSATLPGDDLIGRFGAGLQINNASGLDFRLQYDGQVSSKSTSHAGQLKVMYRY